MQKYNPKYNPIEGYSEGETLYQTFLDLSKAYDGISREKMLDILEKYGVGPKIRRILKTFWDNQVLAVKQNGFYGAPFTIGRGVTQGDIASPTIFNIVVDAVVRVVSNDLEEKENNLNMKIPTLNLYYEDDGYIAGCNSDRVQEALDLTTSLF